MVPALWQQQQPAALQQQLHSRGLAAVPQHAPHLGRRCSSRRKQQLALSPVRASVTAAASLSSCSTSTAQQTSHCCCSSLQQPWPQHALHPLPFRQRQRSAHIAHAAAGPPPDPWQGSQGSGRSATDWGGSSSGGNGSSMPPGGNGAPPGSNGSQSPTASYDAWDAAARPPPTNGTPRYEQTDWGWAGVPEDWDPAAGLGPQQLEGMAMDYVEQLQRRRQSQDPPRDKWITPLLDWQSISGAFDPDQSRTEDAMADEALTNKEESREALGFIARLVVIPLITGALISRAITDPVLNFSLQNNPNAFALSEHQKIEGAQALHMEEMRVKMMMAIGQIPPLNEAGMLEHLHEYALEFQEEEREKNEASLMTLVSDSISATVFFIMFVRDNDARQALFSTIGRLFEGLSDIAKAVLIILVADTLLGYHSEEGWTGFLDLFLGHYGIEVEEENIVLFVGIIPIAIDVLFKYWIFVGLNRISPGAVVTIKQLDRH